MASVIFRNPGTISVTPGPFLAGLSCNAQVCPKGWESWVSFTVPGAQRIPPVGPSLTVQGGGQFLQRGQDELLLPLTSRSKVSASLFFPTSAD